jgi:hypothetical protein
VARTDVIEARIGKLIGGFGRYVRVYDDRVPFNMDQLKAHRQTIALRYYAGSVRAAVENEEFVASLRRTLGAWGLDQRASRLVPKDEFTAALVAALPRIEPLERLTIDAPDLPGDLAERLWQLVESLGVTENIAKIVAGSKTLHHLLPDLVPPIDRAWTGRLFQFHLPEWQDERGQRRIFRLAYNQFVGVARQVRPEQYVTHSGWRTSRTKILDNALSGFCKAELGASGPIEDGTTNQVSFDVLGYPPPKGEALSMMNPTHGYADRVRLLLEQARLAVAAGSFTPVESEPVGLDVVVYSPNGRNRADATNYLGGIGDVLEQKAHRGPLDHLGELADVWLYGNDRQIKAVTYREAEADRASYTVTIREL